MSLFDDLKKYIITAKARYRKTSTTVDIEQPVLVDEATKINIAYANRVVDKNYWMIGCFILLVTNMMMLYFTMGQVDRNQNNTDIRWVKLSRDGMYTVENLNDEIMPDYFMNTVNVKLKEYVNKRFSKMQDSIDADYGFAFQFMSPALKTVFMNEGSASKVANELSTCDSCASEEIKAGTIVHDQADEVILNRRPDMEYHTTIYAKSFKRAPNGNLLKEENKIIRLIWRIRTIREIRSMPHSIMADPIGIEILRDDISKDTR